MSLGYMAVFGKDEFLRLRDFFFFFLYADKMKMRDRGGSGG